MLIACFSIQSIALHQLGGRTVKSESNFFSSLGRIQAGADGNAETMILGSSITGRLPDRAQGFDGIANMGFDGGSAVDVLRAMDEAILPLAPYLIIEANTLHLALNSESTELGVAMRRPWFHVGMRFQGVAAYARPSAFIYSNLLSRRIGGFETVGNKDDLGVRSKPESVIPPPSFQATGHQDELIDEISGILGRLKAKGSKIMIVWLPPARESGKTPPAWILELARRSNTPYWDLGQDADPETVSLTDGVHMSASSAARTVNSLRKGLAAQARQ